MLPPYDHSHCAGVIQQVFAEQGVDITVSTLPPLVPGPYTTAPFHCPHGARFWFEPTGEQIAQWAEAKVE